MAAMWGIHNDKPQFDFVGDGFIALGWNEIGDLRQVGRDRQAMKAAVASAYPRAKAGAIPVWAGVLLRFAFEMAPGDIVVHPEKADATVSIGRVEGDYLWDGSATGNRHRRTVGWLHTGVPRAAFSAGARYEIGASVTLFRVRRHAPEFMAFVDAARRLSRSAPGYSPCTVTDETSADRPTRAAPCARNLARRPEPA